jgi:hypothetical protein
VLAQGPDADQTAAAFAARLKDAVDLDSVRDDLASVVAKTLEPAHVSVWMSVRPQISEPRQDRSTCSRNAAAEGFKATPEPPYLPASQER